VIPSANTIYATINGVNVEILMRDVSTTTQITHVAEKSSTTSDHSTSGTVSVSSNISTSTFLTATHTGMMSIDFDFKVGGSADFSIGSTYTGQLIEYVNCDLWYTGHTNDHDDHVTGDQYSQCTTDNIPTSSFSYSIPANSISEMFGLSEQHQTQLSTAINSGQLSHLIVEVDIYNNMQYVNTIMIYTSDSAQASVTTTLSDAEYSTSNQVYIEYPMTSISEYITTPVKSGDMIEFVVRAKLIAAGTPTPSSDSSEFSSYVQVTTEFGGGVITVGMS